MLVKFNVRYVYIITQRLMYYLIIVPNSLSIKLDAIIITYCAYLNSNSRY